MGFPLATSPPRRGGGGRYQDCVPRGDRGTDGGAGTCIGPGQILCTDGQPSGRGGTGDNITVTLPIDIFSIFYKIS